MIKTRQKFLILSFLSVSFLFIFGCTRNSSTTPADPATALIKRGRAVYQSVCIACHNGDPRLAGSQGPEVWGASLELLEARILWAKYPPGYPAKRQTHNMPAFPQLKDDLPALHAYLNSPTP